MEVSKNIGNLINPAKDRVKGKITKQTNKGQIENTQKIGLYHDETVAHVKRTELIYKKWRLRL